MALTPKQQRFVEEYLVDLNATQAAIRAGYSPRSAKVTASRMLTKPAIAEAISEGAKARSERTRVTADRVLEELEMIATGDVNELMEYRRECCRHCYGIDFRYQRTQRELDAARAAHDKHQEKLEVKAPFDQLGGAGYDRRRDPHPDCPECFGEGVERAHFKDTRKVSSVARRLYAGVKITKEGIEVKTRDQDAALTLLAKHHKLITEKHEHTGKDGAPIAHEITVRFVRAGKPDAA